MQSTHVRFVPSRAFGTFLSTSLPVQTRRSSQIHLHQQHGHMHISSFRFRNITTPEPRTQSDNTPCASPTSIIHGQIRLQRQAPADSPAGSRNGPIPLQSSNYSNMEKHIEWGGKAHRNHGFVCWLGKLPNGTRLSLSSVPGIH